MCGIAGAIIFQDSSFSITPDYLAGMCSALSHRGPDGEGVWVSPDHKVGLAHRRLSIIDLSAAASQPMSNEDGSLWCIFNGEIYNHAQIRQELVRINRHRWKTDHSDTEVILHAFEQWGIDCLDKFRGMFSIALWDARKKELWLIRDRLGIKPLYYSVHNNRLVFGSEIKALLCDPQQQRRIDEESLFHYLSFLTTPAPATIFAGIRKLPAGTWIKINARGDIAERRYWDVLDHTTPLRAQSENEICTLIRDELKAAVKLHKVSDVPVGVFLSGGIDSSTNAALFAEGEQTIETFSIGYQGNYKSYPSELSYARLMAEKIKANHHERLVSIEDLINFLPQMAYLQDEPIADPVCVPIYYVSQLARNNGVTVCQVGEGADELFWGYPQWRVPLYLQHLDRGPVPTLFKSGFLKGMEIIGLKQTVSYEFLRRAAARQPVFWGGVDAFTQSQKQKILSSRLRSRFTDLTSWQPLQPIHQRFEEKAWEKSPLLWMSYLDLNLRLPELLLMRVDKMSMAVGLETRVPYLDHKFVELAMSIPESIKTKNGSLKYILKKAVRGIIPDELIDRKKQGFNVPLYEWFGERLGEITEKELKNFCQDTDLFDPQGIKQLFRQKSRHQLWYLFNFVLWWKKFIK